MTPTQTPAFPPDVSSASHRRRLNGKRKPEGITILSVIDPFRVRVASRSSDAEYEVEVSERTTFCECKGFEMRHRCYHVDAFTLILERAGLRLSAILAAQDAATDEDEPLWAAALVVFLYRQRFQSEAGYRFALALVQAHRERAAARDFDGETFARLAA